jgi:hypothetical protein
VLQANGIGGPQTKHIKYIVVLKDHFFYIPRISGFVVVGTVDGKLGVVYSAGVGGGFSNIVRIQLIKGATRVNRPSVMHALRKLVTPTNSYS